MQVIEIEPMNEQKEDLTDVEKCRFIERVLYWVIIFVVITLIVLFCGEVLQLMHLRNELMQHEFEQLVHLHNEHTHYKPVPWMP